MAKVQADFQRTEGSVFVSVAPPTSVRQATQARRFYRDWSSVADAIASEMPTPTPKPVIEATPEAVSDNPLGDSLKNLLAEVDAIINPKPRVNTEQITRDCYHYGEPRKHPQTNWESPAVAGWRAYQHRKSDALMAYLKQRR